jgi:hypothetical protein
VVWLSPQGDMGSGLGDAMAGAALGDGALRGGGSSAGAVSTRRYAPIETAGLGRGCMGRSSLAEVGTGVWVSGSSGCGAQRSSLRAIKHVPLELLNELAHLLVRA